jgi:cytochrome c oxidase accessory protein FixG
MPDSVKPEYSYRDKVSTIDTQGKRIWIYPKKPRGPLTTKRSLVSLLLLAFFFLAPFIRINGQPLLLFNILERKFIIFSLAFWPQDFHLFVLATIAFVVFIILFTAIFGRIWCGWACPQTIFMEMVFRKIEYFIEGDARNQILLNKAPWDVLKFFRKSLKHIVFYVLSFIIGNIFLAYIIGSDKLISVITDPPSQHMGGLLAMIIFSGVFYGVFAFFREQVCTMVCPYGRLQGVLLDPNSIVVAYDFKRGEPKGRLSKSGPRKDMGDCIDCNQCLAVCPTGIDIRNGTQLECINCTACIDACNVVMKKIRFPTGLIRYASYNGILRGTKLEVTPRIAGYTTVLLFLLVLTSFLIMTRNAIEVTILRTPGVLYQETEEDKISNLYNIKIINKSSNPKTIQLKLKSPSGLIKIVGGDLIVPKNNLAQSAFLVELDKHKIRFVNTPLYIEVYSDEELLEEIQTSFIGPDIWRESQKK